jgi:hypothetical protein
VTKKDQFFLNEKHPVDWPTDWPTTKLRDRQTRPAWKKGRPDSIKALSVELQRFGATSAVLTFQDPADRINTPNPAAAVWFSRKGNDDFLWQDALGLSSAPTLAEISAAFRRISAPHHPDRIANGSGGDIEVFHMLTKHKEAAEKYVKQSAGAYQLVLACDVYAELRWNINSLANSIRSFRQLERDGASQLLERAMQSFSTGQLKAGTEVGDVVKTGS